MRLLILSDERQYQVWAKGLADLTSEQITRGLRGALNFKGFFTLPAFRELCDTIDNSAYGLPDARTAYIEACMAPSPKIKFKWSHEAVYHAGSNTGWSNLHGSTEKQMFPVFQRNYKIMCDRVMNGENLKMLIPLAIPRTISRPLGEAEVATKISGLKAIMGMKGE